MERAVQIFAVVHLTVIGLSHIFAGRAWSQFFLWLRTKEEAGVLVVGAMSLWFGSIIVAFHGVWTGIPLVLTLLGWAQVLKALIYLTFPRYGLKRLQWAPIERHHIFKYPGFILLGLSGLLGYHLFADKIPV